ncbi:MAG: hypothetical protein K1X28_00635 [Parachlamydiales bacterium]|nr:hypothetical protein [Parachlamydiales bacterium]
MATAQIGNLFTLDGRSVRLATDGACLILKGVLVEGKLLDIKIWRKSADGKSITGEALNQPLPLDVIVNVAKAAQDLFANSCFPGYKDYKLSIKNDAPPVYKTIRLKDGVESPLGPDVSKPKEPLLRIHNLLNNSFSAGPPLDGALVKPRYENPSDWLKGIEKETGKPKKKTKFGPSAPPKGSDDDIPDPHTVFKKKKKKTPASDTPSTGTSSSTPSDPATPLTPAAVPAMSEEERLQNQGELEEADAWTTPVNQRTEKPSIGREWPDFLKLLTYQQLQNYSQDHTKGKPSSADANVIKAYNLFAALRKKGEHDDLSGEEQQMFDWLKVMAARVDRFCSDQHYDVYVSEAEKEMLFVDWCRDRAAYVIAGYVDVSSTACDQLKQRLVAALLPISIDT